LARKEGGVAVYIVMDPMKQCPKSPSTLFGKDCVKLKKMRNLPMRFLAMAAALPLAAPLAGHSAEGPLEAAARPIETFYAALVDTMKHGEQLGLQGRFRQLTPVVDEAFNIPAMAQLSVDRPGHRSRRWTRKRS